MSCFIQSYMKSWSQHLCIFCPCLWESDEYVCHRHTFSSLIEVFLHPRVNVPLERGLQECSYFQQVLFAEFFPSAFFQSKVRKMHFYAWHLDFILKLPIVFIHSFVHGCHRQLCKIACSGNLLIVKFSLWLFCSPPILVSRLSRWWRQINKSSFFYFSESCFLF